jgi:LysR family glycine cleavage system transcriptional activator
MTHRLPPLNALRAFEAAARHLSFKRAAQELNVTPGAVSQQVKSLEDLLGVQLFRRSHKALTLSDAGASLLPPVRNAFRQISASVASLAPGEVKKRLTVGVEQMFAMRWLMPRIKRFLESNPGIDIRISTSADFEDLRNGYVDVVICPATADHPDFDAAPVFVDRSVPVCSPAILPAGEPVGSLEELTRFTWIYDDHEERWPSWLAANGSANKQPRTRVKLPSEALAVQAAESGTGVALAEPAAVADALQAGELVVAVEEPAPIPYLLFCSRGISECPEIVALRTWLLAEARSSEGREGRGKDPSAAVDEMSAETVDFGRFA